MDTDESEGVSVCGSCCEVGGASLSKFSVDPGADSSSGESLSSTSATTNFRCVDGVNVTMVMVFGTLPFGFGTTGSVEMVQIGSEMEQTCRPLPFFVVPPGAAAGSEDVLLGSVCDTALMLSGEDELTGVEA